jgi:hypothetical protein
MLVQMVQMGTIGQGEDYYGGHDMNHGFKKRVFLQDIVSRCTTTYYR